MRSPLLFGRAARRVAGRPLRLLALSAGLAGSFAATAAAAAPAATPAPAAPVSTAAPATAAPATPPVATPAPASSPSTPAATLAPGTPLPRPDDEATLVAPRAPDGDGAVTLSGELRAWHKVTLDLAGPFAHERDQAVNPFADYRYTVICAHESGAPVYSIPGYFAADGRAAHTGAEAGTVWRAHLAPDKPGRWTYLVRFVRGRGAAYTPAAGEPLAPYDGRTGAFQVAPTDKTGPDFRAHGRLQYVGGHYLRHAGDGTFFLKAGADAPETLLAYADFDGTVALKPKVPLKTWAPHRRDWRPGDPTWRDGRGRGLIGALNYLAAKGANSVSFLTYNAAGDGDNVWPYVDRDNKYHFDCSKLDQWGIVFDHAQALGLYLHFKLQENELDDHREGASKQPKFIPEAMDAGLTGPERRLYFRELIARFGHALALNWNFGEENTQSYEEQVAMFDYVANLDPYGHHRVIHTFPPQQDTVYPTLLGAQANLTGASLQNHWQKAHQSTLKWVRASAAAGRPWVCANDEQNPASLGVPPDPGYEGFSGRTSATGEGGPAVAVGESGSRGYDLHDIRKYTLWGTLLAGGAGVEYYFGYRLPQNDLLCEDFRSRDRSWDYCRHALTVWRRENLPFWRMACHDELVGNPQNTSSRFCFAAPGEIYLVYLPTGGSCELDLGDPAAGGAFSVRWYNPRTGGALQTGSIATVTGGGRVALGRPPADPTEDWLVLVRR